MRIHFRLYVVFTTHASCVIRVRKFKELWQFLAFQTKQMNLRLQITGGAGYVGSIVSERLLNGPYDVTVVDNLMYCQHGLFHLWANPRFDFVSGDVRDEKLIGGLVKNADIIIPLAAIVGAPGCDRDPLHAK
jgi:nucleoside-diphosphate-sugar epimerase